MIAEKTTKECINSYVLKFNLILWYESIKANSFENYYGCSFRSGKEKNCWGDMMSTAEMEAPVMLTFCMPELSL